MKFKSLFLPVVAVGAATLLTTTPEESHGFALNGGELALAQRDVRVFNNFLDAAANNNTNDHSQFPDYDGAELAFWKASVEWGSELHGNGDGDSTQPFGLGSGGANFDPSWQGRDDATGGTNDNIHSALDASGGSVFAFAEGPYSDGWRCRYYDSWTWSDGPGNVGFNQVDIQGIATHEYGHCLGLGHSATGAATMFGSTSGTDEGDRSIHADDIAGLQAIYGVKSADKPRITSIAVADGLLTIHGEDFTPNNNEVWFSKRVNGTGGNGTPIKVLGLSSQDSGTRIVVSIPSNSGSGDVLVKRGGNSAHDALSNAWPFDENTAPAGGPSISGISPSSVDSLEYGLQPITISGNNFTGTSEVRVDGVALDPLASPPDWALINDDEIEIYDMPLVSNVGSISIEVDTTAGMASSSITVGYPTTPLIEATDLEIVQANGIEITEGASFGDAHLLYVSTDLIPTDFGSFQMGIGNGGATLFLIKVDAIQVKGWKTRFFGPLSGLSIGTMLHWQSAVALLANSYALPWTPTNIESITVAG